MRQFWAGFRNCTTDGKRALLACGHFGALAYLLLEAIETPLRRKETLCPFLLLGTGESLLMLFNFEILQKEYNHCPYDRYPTLLGKGIWQGMA